MRVGIPKKGSSKVSAAFHQCPILPKVGELMVNNQQYDSHDSECFIVDRSTPCLRGVGVKTRSGKEDTTLLSMADCRVKQSTVSTATRYGIKPRIQGCPRGSVRIGGQNIRYHQKKKKMNASRRNLRDKSSWNGIFTHRSIHRPLLNGFVVNPQQKGL